MYVIDDGELVPALVRLRRNRQARLSGAEADVLNAVLSLDERDRLDMARVFRDRLTGILQNHRGEWERRWRR